MFRISLLASVMVVLFLSMSASVGAWHAGPRLFPSDLNPTAETLLDAMTEGVPDAFAIVGVMRWALQPGPEPLIMPPHGGPVVVMVERGQLTATQDGVETLLAAGELYAPGDRTEEVFLQVRGAKEASILVVGFQELGFSTACFWGSNALVHSQQVLILSPAHALPAGLVRLRLERLTVPPGSSLPALEVSPFIWTSVGDGVLGMTLQGQMPFLWERGQERTLYPRQAWPQIPDPSINPLLSGGTQMTLRNAGERPLVLYRLTLTPGANAGP